eukprot:289789_1
MRSWEIGNFGSLNSNIILTLTQIAFIVTYYKNYMHFYGIIAFTRRNGWNLWQKIQIQLFRTMNNHHLNTFKLISSIITFTIHNLRRKISWFTSSSSSTSRSTTLGIRTCTISTICIHCRFILIHINHFYIRIIIISVFICIVIIRIINNLLCMLLAIGITVFVPTIFFHLCWHLFRFFTIYLLTSQHYV